MNSESAKNGFKTFILTLSVSLVVFSVIYYVITNFSDKTASSSEYRASVVQEVSQQEEQPQDSQQQPAVAGAETEKKDTVFGALADSTISQEPKGVVLAGSTVATQTTQSTVPDTGLAGITVGLFSSLFVFALGIFYVARNPRKVALSEFEREVLKDRN